MLGRGYVIESCISLFKNKREEKIYKWYITDALMTIANNTARIAGGNEMIQRYVDLINPPKKDEREDMTVDEFVDSIWSNIKR